MHLKHLEINGFKSFAKKSEFEFNVPITAIVGPNGSGKSNVAEAFRFVLGEQSIKSLRGKKGEDLIFSGEGSRLNRAGVKLVFDNTKRLLNVDFDEVSIERAVYRDGSNEYQINGSKVRLKDITELVAGANVGSSGHHIISQGEADRVLSTNPKERRAMIEDALGLRVFQYKKQESEKKLTKTEENKQQVESLRRENQPHLKFLERQVHKINKSLELREELKSVYREYLRREDAYIALEEDTITELKEGPQQEAKTVEKQIAHLREALEAAEASDARRQEILTLEEELTRTRNELSTLSRELGAAEGQLSFETRRIEAEEKKHADIDERPIAFGEVKVFTEEVSQELGELSGVQDLGHIKERLVKIREDIAGFLHAHTSKKEHAAIDRSMLAELEKKLHELQQRTSVAEENEKQLHATYKTLQEELAREKDESRAQERELFDLMQRHNDLRVTLSEISAREQRLERDREELKRELAEAGSLMGREVLDYKSFAIEDKEGNTLSLDELLDEDRSKQEDRRRELERMKIRLEELGGGNADEILKEYEEVKERDQFLESELQDLEKTSESLRGLIADLDRELEEKFTQGIDKISSAFGEFFTLMFGGGKASLLVVKERKRKTGLKGLLGIAEEDEIEEVEGEEEFGDTGVDIAVSLPNKKVKGLMMLSGGERALTSIALIFAMSQVNPPPFLILDETDAALDEANSRRYGDMIEALAKHSQLIVITHNRETMSRAGVLYGVTMGGDGVSKLLSVQFEEGLAYAK